MHQRQAEGLRKKCIQHIQTVFFGHQNVAKYMSLFFNDSGKLHGSFPEIPFKALGICTYFIYNTPTPHPHPPPKKNHTSEFEQFPAQHNQYGYMLVLFGPFDSSRLRYRCPRIVFPSHYFQIGQDVVLLQNQMILV